MSEIASVTAAPRRRRLLLQTGEKPQRKACRSSRTICPCVRARPRAGSAACRRSRWALRRLCRPGGADGGVALDWRRGRGGVDPPSPAPHDEVPNVCSSSPILLPGAGTRKPAALPALLQATPWDGVSALPKELIEALRSATRSRPPRPIFEGNPFRGLGAFTQEHTQQFAAAAKPWPPWPCWAMPPRPTPPRPAGYGRSAARPLAAGHGQTAARASRPWCRPASCP